MAQGLKVVFGAGMFGNMGPWTGEDYVNKSLSILSSHGCNILDTAQLYPGSEKLLGQVKAGERFTIDTKWQGGFPPGWASKENVVKSAKESLSQLGMKQVDIFYIHCPDGSTPLEDTLAGVEEVYRSGAFKRFGLSNFPASEVQKVYDICKAKGYVLPTVYQGNYSPVARLQETILFPTLRKLDIAFYAYSPLAGGFLTKSAQQIRDGAGRFNETFFDGMYRDMYGKPSYLEALAKWEAIAGDEGCTRAELAYRWVTYNSPLSRKLGDGIIIGSSTIEQLEQTLKGLEKGPLSQKACQGIDAIWEDIKHEAPVDNVNR